MTWKALALDLYRAGSWLVGFVLPPTKKKLHRIMHTAGTALAVLLAASVWFTDHSASAKLVADVLVAATYLARWQVVVGRLDAVVDKLPIPEDSDLRRTVLAASPGTTISGGDPPDTA